jgi:hypothetical protein
MVCHTARKSASTVKVTGNQSLMSSSKALSHHSQNSFDTMTVTMTVTMTMTVTVSVTVTLAGRE